MGTVTAGEGLSDASCPWCLSAIDTEEAEPGTVGVCATCFGPIIYAGYHPKDKLHYSDREPMPDDPDLCADRDGIAQTRDIWRKDYAALMAEAERLDADGDGYADKAMDTATEMVCLGP